MGAVPATATDRIVIIDRYISTEIARLFCLGLGLLILVFLGFSAARQLNLAAEGQLDLLTAARLIGLNTLMILDILLPSALFFSVLAALARLHRDVEVNALYAAGVSPLRILGAVLKLALVVALITGLFSIEGRPWAYRESYRLEARAAAQFGLRKIASGRFVTMGDSDYTFIADDLELDEGLHRGVFLQRSQGDGSRAEIIYAAAAALPTLNADEPFTAEFFDGYNYILDNREQLDVTLEFERLTVRLPATPAQERYRRRAETTAELARSERPKDIAEYQWRISIPLATVLLALIAVPLSRASPRQSRSRSFIAAIATYVGLFTVASVVRTWVEQGLLGPVPGLWSAYVVYALVLLFLVFGPRMGAPR